MTVIVTRDVAARFRGFLASCALELAPGVYTAPRMNKAIRDRVWTVLEEWYAAEPRGAVVMTWLDREVAAGQSVRTLGEPAKELVDVDELLLVRRARL